jgi:N-acetylneuraminic acid mutarotase
MPTTTPIDQVRLIDFTDAEPQTGMGFNSATLVFPGTALSFSPGSPDPAETGKVVTGHATIISSHEELMDQIGVSVAASGRYGLASASAKMNFSKSTGYNSSSTFVLAQASVVNPIVRGKDFQLTGPASALLNALNIDSFKTAFGDSFVRGIKSGGEFFAVFRLTSLRQETQQQLASTLTAEINGLLIGGASFSAAFTTAQQSENDRAEVEISFYQAAGSGITASITLDVQEILNRLKNFPTFARDNPFPFKAEIATYDTIPIAMPPPVEVEDFIFSMSQDERKKLDYIKRKNDVDFALQHTEYFDDLPSSTDLGADSELYQQLINAVMHHQVQLAKGQFPTPEVFDPAKVGLTEPVPRQFKRKPELTGGTWATKASMPTARQDVGLAAAANGQVYAIGGGTAQGGHLTTVEAYDPTANTWTAKTAMPTGRDGLAVAAANNGKIYAIGGIHVSGPDPIATVEEYDPATDSWTTKAPMPTARNGLAATAASNGKIYAVGGTTRQQVGISTVEEYDPTTDSWTTKASMPTGRAGLALAAARNGKIYAVGGFNHAALGTVEEYDPATNTWATKASMPTARLEFGISAASNGKIYAIGGTDAAFHRANFATVEEYDPDTDKWTTKTPMPTGRASLGVAAATNGKVYAVGGGTVTNFQETDLAMLEEYTP